MNYQVSPLLAVLEEVLETEIMNDLRKFDEAADKILKILEEYFGDDRNGIRVLLQQDSKAPL